MSTSLLLSRQGGRILVAAVTVATLLTGCANTPPGGLDRYAEGSSAASTTSTTTVTVDTVDTVLRLALEQVEQDYQAVTSILSAADEELFTFNLVSEVETNDGRTLWVTTSEGTSQLLWHPETGAEVVDVDNGQVSGDDAVLGLLLRVENTLAELRPSDFELERFDNDRDMGQWAAVQDETSVELTSLEGDLWTVVIESPTEAGGVLRTEARYGK